MRSLDFSRYALMVYVTAAMLAGCGGSQPPTGAMPQTPAMVAHADGGRSRMLPKVVTEDLLYVSTLVGTKVYSYPEGKHVGTLRALKYANFGECADEAGDVFISDGRALLEYKHDGKKPIQTLTQSGYNAGSCTSNAATGNLAVTWSNYSNSQFNGYVAVYKDARGTPTVYTLNGTVPNYCGYDDKGNLFCDGITNNGDLFRFAELPKGGNALIAATLNQSIGFGYSVQWDGKYLTVQDANVNKIYRFAFSGSSGTLKGTVDLELVGKQYAVNPTLIVGKTVMEATIALVSSTQPYGYVNYYKYPEGGSPIKTISVGD